MGRGNSCCKREVKLGEIVIRKRKIIESKKVDIDIKRERVIVEYSDGLKEEPNIGPLLESKTKFNNVTRVALFCDRRNCI